jgi:hypothetical protein
LNRNQRVAGSRSKIYKVWQGRQGGKCSKVAQSTTPKTNRKFDQNKYNRKQVNTMDSHELKERGNIAILTRKLEH